MIDFPRPGHILYMNIVYIVQWILSNIMCKQHNVCHDSTSFDSIGLMYFADWTHGLDSQTGLGKITENPFTSHQLNYLTWNGKKDCK